ncbi:MAG: serine hydrolase domain-containing protein, partial [Nocardioidaceae bacterium]
LHHRAGLWEWWPTYVSCSGPDEAIRLVTALPLRYPPRSERHYSDLGFMIVGRAVEEVTGLRLPDAFAELVGTPLGLSGIRYGGPPAGTAAAASSPGDRGERRMIETGEPYPVPVDASRFDRWRNHVLVGEVDDGNAFHTFGGAAGHAGLFGTVAALHALGRALLDSASGRGIWSPDVVHEFWTNGPDDGQLLGFWSRTTVVGSCRAQAIGHTGFPGVGFAVLPEHDASVVLATNRLHVRGEPARFVPMWSTALDAAHATLHAAHQ